MAKYCDSAKLELHWFRWLVADATPTLEPYRRVGCLWSRTVGTVMETGQPDPQHHRREHCLLLPRPIFFTTDAGVPDGDLSAVDLVAAVDNHENWTDQLMWVPELCRRGYWADRPAAEYWNIMSLEIHRICVGVSQKFRKQEEDAHELISDAIAQVMSKIKNKKLIYCPGRAPVFNLLTTTIMRCMFSVLNRNKRNNTNMNALLDQARGKALHSRFRSLRIATT